jgi:hypothetical protein
LPESRWVFLESGVGVTGGDTVIFVLESAGFPSSEDNPRPFCKTRSTAC